MDDTQRLNSIENLKKGYGKGWICRNSSHGRGLRIHETSDPSAFPTIREAIDAFLKIEKLKK